MPFTESLFFSDFNQEDVSNRINNNVMIIFLFGLIEHGKVEKYIIIATSYFMLYLCSFQQIITCYEAN